MTLAEIKKQRERMGELATEARNVLDTITPEMDSSASAEIEGRFDQMMSDHDALQSRVEREERLLAIEQRGMPTGASDEEAEESRGEDRQKVADYREVFSKAVRFGVGTLSGAESEVLRNNRADLPAELRAQSVGTDSAGGYTVPEGFSYEIDKALAMWGPMWDATIVRELVTSTGNRLPWPTVDDTAKTGAIKAENAAATDDGGSDVVFGEKQLDAYVYDTEVVRIPMELLQDSAFDMESTLTELFGERLGRTANTALTTGTGSSQPNGIATAAGTGVTAAGTAAITSDEIIDLLHSVDPAYRMSPRCRFMFNDTTCATIRKLKDGDGNYLWQMGDIRNGEPATILGHAYSINQAMADLGASAKPIIFGDFGRYVVRKVRDFSVLTLRERYAENFQVGMIGFKRFDGELLNASAVKALVNAES